ncbi:hypothetical protein [Streptomyces sp. NPDC091217]
MERRRRIDQALHAVIMEAYVRGVSLPVIFFAVLQEGRWPLGPA